MVAYPQEIVVYSIQYLGIEAEGVDKLDVHGAPKPSDHSAEPS